MCCDGVFHQTHKTLVSVNKTQEAEKTRQRLMSCLTKQEQFCNCSDIWEGKDVVKVKSALSLPEKSLALPKKSPSSVPSFIHVMTEYTGKT